LREPGQRVLGAEVLEDVFEGGNNPAEQDTEDAGEDDEDGARIDHRTLELPAQLHRLFVVDGETREDGVEDAADLAGLDEVDVEGVEYLWMTPERVAERGALLDVRLHVTEDGGERLVVRLVAEDVEALHDRQTRVDHRGEEARERDDVAKVDARP